MRLQVERRSYDPTLLDSSTAASPDGKSPKVFGLPRPYTGLYSASSYMANRPSYMRNREVGDYTLNSTSSSSEISAANNKKSSTSSLGRLPGMSGILGVAATPTGSAVQSPMSSDTKVKELVDRLPPAPTKAGTTTETVTKRTFTETTVKRVTNNKVEPPKIEDVVLVKAGGPMGLSIIGGSDHICVPFGTGDPGIFISKVSEILKSNGTTTITFNFFFSTVRLFRAELLRLRENYAWEIVFCQLMGSI